MHVKLIYERRGVEMKNFRMVFKTVAYVYVSWQICHGLDVTVAKRIAPWAKNLTEKINAEAEERKNS